LLRCCARDCAWEGFKALVLESRADVNGGLFYVDIQPDVVVTVGRHSGLQLAVLMMEFKRRGGLVDLDLYVRVSACGGGRGWGAALLTVCALSS
jgi:hypothetical protein